MYLSKEQELTPFETFFLKIILNIALYGPLIQRPVQFFDIFF